MASTAQQDGLRIYLPRLGREKKVAAVFKFSCAHMHNDGHVPKKLTIHVKELWPA